MSMDWQLRYEEALGAHQRQEWDRARMAYEEALAAAPGEAAILKAYGVLKSQTGDLDGGIALMRRAVEVDPGDAETWSNLCNALLLVEENEECVAAGQKAVQLNPQNAFAHNNLAAGLRLLKDYEGSWEHAKTALELKPDYTEARINAASCLLAIGEVDSANAMVGEAIKQDPKSLKAWNIWLFGLHYSDSVTTEEIREAHGLFDSLFHPQPRPLMKSEPKTVGFVSGDLIKHPVGSFMKPLFENYDRERWRFVVFHNREKEDELSAELRGLVDAWHPCTRLTDPELAQVIRDDGVDILIDLSGHTAKNRLAAFAYRPAPVQATFLGYSSTTGLGAMDFLIADPVLVPEGQEGAYTEDVARMDRSVYCMPVSVREPAEQGDGKVFGSFNNPYKISNGVIEAWAEILKRVPDAKLVLKYISLDALEVREALQERLVRAGVDPARLEFYGWVEYEEHLRIIGSVKVALDSFPYTGATTAVDTMKSGTPLVTLAGDRYSARMAASVLDAFGLEELVAEDVESYIEKAVGLMNDDEAREAVRRKIASSAQDSDFSDGAEYARSFERVLLNMWDKVLATKT